MSSYILDRDLLSSSRNQNHNHNHNWIDVNSNQCLLGSSQYARSDAETRKMITDVRYWKIKKFSQEVVNRLYFVLCILRQFMYYHHGDESIHFFLLSLI